MIRTPLDLAMLITTAVLALAMPPSALPRERGPTDVRSPVTFRRIDQGAQWEEHWAYRPPIRPAIPAVQRGDWPHNPIDYFILSRLESEGLLPTEVGDRYRLIRRVTLDLTGLPPSIEEVDAFVGDSHPDAYERLVDRLLSSPDVGEHLGRQWLDVARYADTNGYHIDTGRSIWPYRDWIIRAFNDNMPFDQFTIEQLAGDLLPNPTPSQRIATGFHRNTMFNEEGGIDPEEFRTKAVVDRVNTTMTAWMATTIACAECHDHKYDPFSQQEFYQLYAFFNQVPETGGGTLKTPLPIARLEPPAKLVPRLEQLRAEIARLKAEAEASEARLDQALAAWEQQVKDQGLNMAWELVDPDQLVSEGEASLTKLEDFSVRAEGKRPSTDKYVVRAHTHLKRITAVRLEVLTDECLPQGGPGRHDNGNLVLSEFTVAAGPKAPGGGLQPVPVKIATADFEQQGWEAAQAIDKALETGWRVYPRIGESHLVVFELENDLQYENGTSLAFTLNQQSGEGATIGRFRLSVTGGERPVRAIAQLPQDIADVHDIAQNARSPQQWERLRAYYRSIQPDPLSLARKELDAVEAQIPFTLVMEEMLEKRPSHVHVRGNFLQPGRPVKAGVPEIFHALEVEEGCEPNRLHLARWLVHEANPLSARVTMNRYWRMLFGVGLVKTEEDFGTQGEPPFHPELLDWLATEFVRSGWNVKAMLRLMVTSATYRQSSEVTGQLIQVDPENRLLARGPRFRLDAEVIRDSALAISGLLTRHVGGSSVYPYQPAGLWDEKLLTGYGMGEWPTSTGADLYRRGMYTFLRRSVPYPTFATFDAPSREYCAVNRPRTNTPLQALTTLNDPQFVEAARVFAERIMREGGADVEARVTYAFRMCLARPPSPREKAILAGLYHRQLARFRTFAGESEKLVSNGRAPRPMSLDTAELAAWTIVGNVLLNLDETVNKG